MYNKDLFVLENIPESFTGKENLEYFKKYKDGNLEARDKLIIHNLKLVFYVVYKTYSTSSIDSEELISIGIIGLIKAVDTFDINKGFQFISYAKKCINNEILLFMRKEKKKGKTVSLDEYIFFEDFKVSDMIYSEEDLASDYEEKETLEEIRNLISSLSEENKLIYDLYYNKGLSQKDIATMLNISQSGISLRMKRLLRYLENEMYRREIVDKKANVKTKRPRVYY